MSDDTPFDDYEAVAEELMDLGWVGRGDAQWEHLKKWCEQKACEWKESRNVRA